ncbi:MAG: alcohol dehydrogenase catalytic domain-containing protein [Deltaproteobacteria bacterium]|nr:alcohol dehydrogenase catalytic domain-containing protein [Deltaproteobacteria bacterium]
MLALLLRDSKALVSDAVPAPVRAKGEALVRVRTSGVCDTDLQLARGYMGFSGVPGHEMVGEVVEADDASWKGKRVVADINAGCGTCADCTLRDGHHCAARTVLGILGRSGSFAEHLAVPERCLVEVPASVSDDAAVFAEPLAAALHVVDELEGAKRPARAIVLGDGKLGQLIVRAVASEGIPTTLVGRHAHKLALARKASGVEAFLEGELPASHHGAELVVEATGSEAGLARALELVAPRGTVVLKTTVAAKLNVDLAPLVIHEVKLVGSRCGDMKRAISALSRGAVDPLPLIEARYPLARADEALAHAGRKGALKILVDA